MIKKIGISLVIGMLTFSQPITLIADTIDSGVQSIEQEFSNKSIDSDGSAVSDSTETSSDGTMDSTESESFSSEQVNEHETNQSFDQSNLDSGNEKQFSQENSTTNSEFDTTTSTGKEVAESALQVTPAAIATGRWGTVPWEFDDVTGTFYLKGGNGGNANNAPWNSAAYERITKKIVIEERVVMSGSGANSLFYAKPSVDASVLEEIIGLENLDLSQTNNVVGMFNRARNLKRLDISSFDLSGVSSLGTFFRKRIH